MITRFVSLILGGVIVYLFFPFEIISGLQPQSKDIPSIAMHNSTNNYTKIFDGNILHGWKMAGNGNFVVTEDKSLKSGGQGILWYTKAIFDNFVLRLDWKVSG